VVSLNDRFYFDHDESRYNFMLFVTVWSFFIMLYTGLARSVFSRIYHSLIGLALLSLTSLFWFAGSIAIAVDIPTNCGSSGNCRIVQAATAFGFFIWAIFSGLAVMEGLGSRGGARADVRK